MFIRNFLDASLVQWQLLNKEELGVHEHARLSKLTPRLKLKQKNIANIQFYT